MEINWEQLEKEFKYSTTRSSGSGGQHVNKVETKVIVKLDIDASSTLSNDEKSLLKKKLKSRLSKGTEISMYCQATRSQLKNKERLTKNFIKLIKKSLEVQKKRKPKKISQAEKEKKLHNKRKRSELKRSRQKPKLDV